MGRGALGDGITISDWLIRRGKGREERDGEECNNISMAAEVEREKGRERRKAGEYGQVVGGERRVIEQ